MKQEVYLETGCEHRLTHPSQYGKIVLLIGNKTLKKVKL
jgi:hypothetical protein